MNIIFKSLFTLFTALIAIVYWHEYGPQNYLWLSDIGLFLTVAALWLESSLLISIAAVGILPLEAVWTLDFCAHILTGTSPVGLTGYMFDLNLPLYLRAISLFHLVLPVMWLWLLEHCGYDGRGFKYATILCTAVFIATYALPDPFENINLIFTPQFRHLTWISPRGWFVGQIIVLPIFLFYPMHKILEYFFAKK